MLDTNITDNGSLLGDVAWSMDFKKGCFFLVFTLHGFWKKEVLLKVICQWGLKG